MFAFGASRVYLNLQTSALHLPSFLLHTFSAWKGFRFYIHFLNYPAPGVPFHFYILFYSIMPQAYRSVPSEEQSQTSRDDASLNEKFEWRAENKSVSERIRNVSTSHWAWIVQAIMLTASITFFAVGVCMRSSKKADTIPMTWCKQSTSKLK